MPSTKQFRTNLYIILQSKFRNSIEESRPNKKQVLRNEAPDKLWPFVEQFCAAPTQKQLVVSYYVLYDFTDVCLHFATFIY